MSAGYWPQRSWGSTTDAPKCALKMTDWTFSLKNKVLKCNNKIWVSSTFPPEYNVGIVLFCKSQEGYISTVHMFCIYVSTIHIKVTAEYMFMSWLSCGEKGDDGARQLGEMTADHHLAFVSSQKNGYFKPRYDPFADLTRWFFCA